MDTVPNVPTLLAQRWCCPTCSAGCNHWVPLCMQARTCTPRSWPLVTSSIGANRYRQGTRPYAKHPGHCEGWPGPARPRTSKQPQHHERVQGCSQRRAHAAGSAHLLAVSGSMAAARKHQVGVVCGCAAARRDCTLKRILRNGRFQGARGGHAPGDAKETKGAMGRCNKASNHRAVDSPWRRKVGSGKGTEQWA